MGRQCDRCGQKMPPFVPRKRVDDDLCCAACASGRPGGGSAQAVVITQGAGGGGGGGGTISRMARSARFQAAIEKAAGSPVEVAEVTTWGREFSGQRALLAYVEDGERLVPVGALVWNDQHKQVVSVVVLDFARRQGIARHLFEALDRLVGYPLPDDGYRTTEGDALMKALNRPEVPLVKRVTEEDAARPIQGLFWAFLNATPDDPDLKVISMRKGAPFAGYDDFDDCVAKNADKDDPQAYCGKIKHQVEEGRKDSARHHQAGERPFIGADAWILVDKNLEPLIHPDTKGYYWPRLEGEQAIREGYVGTDSHLQLPAHELVDAQNYEVVWASRHGERARWHVFPREGSRAASLSRQAGWRVLRVDGGMLPQVYPSEELAQAEADRLGGEVVYEGFDESGLPTNRAASRRVAHDSGDSQTIFHCPFCGGGNVIARSDGTAWCEFCKSAFTVQVQPEHNTMPQTVNDEPFPIPDMPGEPERPSWTTSTGAKLTTSDYIAHLAIKHAKDGAERGRVVQAVRTARREG